MDELEPLAEVITEALIQHRGPEADEAMPPPLFAGRCSCGWRTRPQDLRAAIDRTREHRSRAIAEAIMDAYRPHLRSYLGALDSVLP